MGLALGGSTRASVVIIQFRRMAVVKVYTGEKNTTHSTDEDAQAIVWEPLPEANSLHRRRS